MAGDHLGRVRLSALADRFLVGLLRSLYLSSQRREMACRAEERQLRSGGLSSERHCPRSTPSSHSSDTVPAACSMVLATEGTRAPNRHESLRCGVHLPGPDLCRPQGVQRRRGRRPCLQSAYSLIERISERKAITGQCSLEASQAWVQCTAACGPRGGEL